MSRGIVLTALLFLLVPSVRAQAPGEPSNTSLHGSQAFVTGPPLLSYSLVRPSLDPQPQGAIGALQARGVLVFDGEGGLTGHRFVWDWTLPSTVELDWGDPMPVFEDHRLSPVRQEIVGTYDVGADSRVSLSYTVSPALFFGKTYTRQIGVQTASAQESAQAILASEQRLFGFLEFSLAHDYFVADEMNGHEDWESTATFQFETLGVEALDRSAPHLHPPIVAPLPRR